MTVLTTQKNDKLTLEIDGEDLKMFRDVLQLTLAMLKDKVYCPQCPRCGYYIKAVPTEK